MSDFDFLKQEARKNAGAAEYLDGISVKLAQEILNMRLKKGLSQAQLGELAGITQKTISRIEGGDPGVKIGTYEKVLLALKTDVYIEIRNNDELAATAYY